MIQGFKQETAELNDQEINSLQILKRILISHKGSNNSIKSDEIIRQLRLNQVVIPSGARIRKMINVLRRTDLPDLAASSNGYYIETDLRKLKEYSQSLRDRASAILAVSDSIDSHISKTREQEALKSQTNLFSKI
jgi:hypothetical protein